MGRLAHISREDLIGAASRVAARLGPSRASVGAIAREAGVPVGSVYHRVPSRAALMAEVWNAAADRYVLPFLQALDGARSLNDAVEVTLIAPRLAREDPAAGVVLFVHRRDDFLDEAPAELRAHAGKLASSLQEGLGRAAPRLLPGERRGRERLAVALLGIPYGALRVFLPQAVPPPELDRVIVAAARAALGN